MKSSFLFFLGCYAFISLGISAALIGPALPTLATRSGVGVEQLGIIFSTMSFGYLSSAPVIHFLAPRLGFRNMLFLSPFLVVIAMILLGIGHSFLLFCAATFLLGLGQSGTQVTYNSLIGLQYEGAKVSGMLNRMNAFFGVGALVGPLIVVAGYSIFGNADIAFWASALVALPLSLGAIALGPTLQSLRANELDRTSTTAAMHTRHIITSPIVWMMCAVMGLYVGCEVAFSGWATEFTARTLTLNAAQAAISVSLFWMGLAISRYFTDTFVKHIQPVNFMVISAAVSMIGLLMMTSQALPVLAYLGAFLVGAGFGPVYPTLIAIGIQRFRYAAQLVSSILTSAGSLGSLFLPTLTGYVLIANPVTAWLLLVGVLIVMIGLWLVVRHNLDTSPLPVPNASQEKRVPEVV